jgi:2-oxoglutarate ferredoxin oxidoreductase subunit beta
MAVAVTEYNTDTKPTWCPGCGNYIINTAIKKTFSDLDLKPNQAFISFDIGCNGNGADKIKVNAFKGLHGRAIPLAIGSHLANRKIPVIADIGDGGALHEGIEHLIHAIRSNYNIMILIHNNQNFALTTGQATATTQESKPMYGLPEGRPEREMFISDLVLSQSATFYARAYSGDLQQMVEIFKSAINHKGCSIVEIAQICPTYNKEANPQWFTEKIRKLDKPATTIEEAMKISKLDDNINMGIIYQNTNTPTFYDRLENRKNTSTELVDEVKNYDISKLLQYLD